MKKRKVRLIPIVLSLAIGFIIIVTIYYVINGETQFDRLITGKAVDPDKIPKCIDYNTVGVPSEKMGVPMETIDCPSLCINTLTHGAICIEEGQNFELLTARTNYENKIWQLLYLKRYQLIKEVKDTLSFDIDMRSTKNKDLDTIFTLGTSTRIFQGERKTYLYNGKLDGIKWAFSFIRYDCNENFPLDGKNCEKESFTRDYDNKLYINSYDRTINNVGVVLPLWDGLKMDYDDPQEVDSLLNLGDYKNKIDDPTCEVKEKIDTEIECTELNEEFDGISGRVRTIKLIGTCHEQKINLPDYPTKNKGVFDESFYIIYTYGQCGAT